MAMLSLACPSCRPANLAAEGSFRNGQVAAHIIKWVSSRANARTASEVVAHTYPTSLLNVRTVIESASTMGLPPLLRALSTSDSASVGWTAPLQATWATALLRSSRLGKKRVHTLLIIRGCEVRGEVVRRSFNFAH